MIDLTAIRRAVDPKYKGGSDVRCPVHEDGTPSLSINVSREGKLLCHCQAGCDQRAVWEAVTAAAKPYLNGHADNPGELGRTVYEYRADDGKPLVRKQWLLQHEIREQGLKTA